MIEKSKDRKTKKKTKKDNYAYIPMWSWLSSFCQSLDYCYIYIYILLQMKNDA